MRWCAGQLAARRMEVVCCEGFSGLPACTYNFHAFNVSRRQQGWWREVVRRGALVYVLDAMWLGFSLVGVRGLVQRTSVASREQIAEREGTILAMDNVDGGGVNFTIGLGRI